MQDEEGLVQRARQGDKEAFTQLYETHFDRVFRYLVVRVRNKAEVEDMTQQVFVKAFEAMPSFRWKGIPFSAWLFRIAHNLVVDYIRKVKKQPVTVPFEEVVVIGDDDPQKEAERKLDIERLISATRQLTEAQREVISLRFAGGLPVAQVARVMGKSGGAIKALQHSAIVALRKALSVGEDSEKG